MEPGAHKTFENDHIIWPDSFGLFWVHRAHSKARYWRGRKKDESRNVTNIHQELQRTEGQSRPRSDSTRLRHLGKYYTGRLAAKGFRESKIQEVDNRAEGKVR